jgi:hypothetical protein
VTGIKNESEKNEQKKNVYVLRFVVFTAVGSHVLVFWVVAPCSLVDVCRSDYEVA